jgi:hypothetical protein
MPTRAEVDAVLTRALSREHFDPSGPDPVGDITEEVMTLLRSCVEEGTP